ncbi:MAG: VTT domain-containing protein [Candidatus Handelsmanbacteria bacterium]|nr:VTT domain-containing protein [Candidatus Handelsmanbacteria bacterium]
MGIEPLQTFLADLGPTGVIVLAILDSAGMPTLGGPDALLLLMAPNFSIATGLWLLAGTVAGSALGCLILYYVGRRGGEPLLARFGGAEKREWVRQKIQRYDFTGIFAAAIGPPPFPTKLFVLSAGVLGMEWKRLLVAVILGRTLRYGVAWYLGLLYGVRAAELLSQHYLSIFTGVVVLLALLLLIPLLSRRWSKPSA